MLATVHGVANSWAQLSEVTFFLSFFHRGKLGLVLMGGAILSISLIQFSVVGWGCVPSLLFTWGQIMVEEMKIMATSLQRSYACTATLFAPNPAVSHH